MTEARRRSGSRPLPVPKAAKDVYRGWLAMIPESRQHSTLDLFYGFVHLVFHWSRQPRDGRWLRALLERDAPQLPSEAIDWYCDRFEIISQYEQTTFKTSQVLQLWVRGREDERFAEVLRRVEAGLDAFGNRP